MPPTYCPCPRPILKRRSPIPATELTQSSSSTSPRDESAQLLGIDPSILQPLVRFPPKSTLACVFQADSPSTYDRSPIVVNPNNCSLPERGCPGKTYVPSEDTLGAAIAFASRRNGGLKSSKDHSPMGRHLTRAVHVHLSFDDENCEDLTPRATPVAYTYPLPPLIPDLSSSSESEESDGFSSPPLEAASMSECFFSYHHALAPTTSERSHPRRFQVRMLIGSALSFCFFHLLSDAYSSMFATSSPAAGALASTPRTPGLSIPIPSPDLSSSFSAMYLSPKSSPSSPLSSFRSRNFAFSSRSSSPARSRSRSPCRDASPHRRRQSHSKSKRVRGSPGSPVSPGEVETQYKSFSERSALTSCALDVPDVGCFGGF